MDGNRRVLLARPARREVILRAAAAAFAGRGFAATSMEEVAEAAGITRLIVYRHFPSKEELYEAVLARVRDRLEAEFRADGPERRPESAATRALLTVARENPAGVKLLLRHAIREPQFAGYAEDFRQQVDRMARRLLARSGSLRGDDWAAETLVSFVFDAVLHWVDDRPEEADEDFLRMMGRSLPALVHAWARV